MSEPTAMEKQILQALQTARASVITTRKLAAAAGWYFPGGLPMTNNTVHQHIRNLRKKGYPVERVTGYRLVRRAS